MHTGGNTPTDQVNKGFFGCHIAHRNLQTVGALTVVDGTVSNTAVFIQTTTSQPSFLAGSILLDNVLLSNVSHAVVDNTNKEVLSGGSRTIGQWAQGNVYQGTSGQPKYVQAVLNTPAKPASLLQGGKFVSRPRPDYHTYDVSQFVSVKALGAKGDGNSDDTATLKSIFAKVGGLSRTGRD